MQHLRSPPVARANLLVGKLCLLHQTKPGCAKKFPHNEAPSPKTVATQQQPRTVRHIWSERYQYRAV